MFLNLDWRRGIYLHKLFQMPPGIWAPVQTLQLYSRDNHLPQTQSKLVIIFLHSVPDRKLSSTSKFWRVAAISDLSNKSCFHLDLYLRHHTQHRTAQRAGADQDIIYRSEKLKTLNLRISLSCGYGAARGRQHGAGLLGTSPRHLHLHCECP